MPVSVLTPFPVITDIDGQPLDDGFLWIGVDGLDPVTNPQNAYWDAALTQLATQPVRTRGGYALNGSTRGRLFTLNPYSIRVNNQNGSTVYSSISENGLFGGNVDAATVNFVQSGTGAVSRSVQSKLRETVSVKDFGAVGNGVANDTTAIQNAINSLGAAGGIVRFPAGTYRTTSVITVANSKTYLQGDGIENTVIVPTTASQVGFLFQASSGPIASCMISDMDIAPTAVISDCIRVIDHFWFVARNVRFPDTAGSFTNAINLYKGATAYLAFLENVFVLSVGSQVGVRVGESGTGDIQNVFLYNCHLNNASTSGLRVKNVGGLVWVGGEALSCNRAATFEAGGTDRIKAVFCTNIFFDNATNETVRITVDALTARLSGVSFSNCSMNFSQAGDGVIIAGQAGDPGQLERVRFDGCDILLNEKAGVVLTNCRDIKLMACNVQGNSEVGAGSFAGLFADAGVQGLQIFGGTYGGGDEFASTQSYGIQLTASASQVRIAGPDLNGNATGPLLDSGATNVVIRDCIGFTTSNQGSATVTSGNTSVNVNHGLSVTPAVADIQITPAGDVTERWWVSAAGATTFTITLSGAAGANRTFNWLARVRGA